MRTETRIVYITDDGKEFDSEIACALYEHKLKLEIKLSQGFPWSAGFAIDGIGPEDLVDWITRNGDFLRKWINEYEKICDE